MGTAMAPLLSGPSIRLPDVNGTPQPMGKITGHHANDGQPLAIEKQSASQNICITGKATLPKAVADDRNAVFAGLVVRLVEHPPERGRNSQSQEKISRCH